MWVCVCFEGCSQVFVVFSLRHRKSMWIDLSSAVFAIYWCQTVCESSKTDINTHLCFTRLKTVILLSWSFVSWAFVSGNVTESLSFFIIVCLSSGRWSSDGVLTSGSSQSFSVSVWITRSGDSEVRNYLTENIHINQRYLWYLNAYLVDLIFF